MRRSSSFSASPCVRRGASRLKARAHPATENGQARRPRRAGGRTVTERCAAPCCAPCARWTRTGAIPTAASAPAETPGAPGAAALVSIHAASPGAAGQNVIPGAPLDAQEQGATRVEQPVAGSLAAIPGASRVGRSRRIRDEFHAVPRGATPDELDVVSPARIRRETDAAASPNRCCAVRERYRPRRCGDPRSDGQSARDCL